MHLVFEPRALTVTFSYLSRNDFEIWIPLQAQGIPYLWQKPFIYLAENARIIGYKSSMPDEKRIPEVGAAHLNAPSKRCSIRLCVFVRERVLVAVLMDIMIVCVPTSYKALIHHIFLSYRQLLPSRIIMEKWTERGYKMPNKLWAPQILTHDQLSGWAKSVFILFSITETPAWKQKYPIWKKSSLTLDMNEMFITLLNVCIKMLAHRVMILQDEDFGRWRSAHK